jgi:23S rRNA (adenine2503-C2)-methyltransferase
MLEKQNFFGLSLPDLEVFFAGLGKEKFRAKQIFKWVYEERVQSIEDMTNLSKAFREDLKGKLDFALPKPVQVLDSVDGTRKFLFEIEGLTFETVLIPAKNRMTICLSSEVGCNMACRFCYTGKQKLKRRLTAAEIVGQFVVASDSLKNEDRRISNIVFMGMGEPLDNSDNVFKAIDIITDHHGYKLGRRKITVSTSGIVPEMHKIWENKVRMAVSLNASSDEIRNFVMPINKRYPLKDLLAVCKEYTDRTSNRVTFEYVLLKGVTDRMEDAVRVHQLVKNIPCKINLIPFNEHPGTEFFRPDDDVVEKFMEKMMSYGYQAIVRKTMGRDIFAACGQLTSMYEGRPETLKASIEAAESRV